MTDQRDESEENVWSREGRPARDAGLDVAVAQALTVFEAAVRRHSAALTELTVARRPSTSKAALKTTEELGRARAALTRQLGRLGWAPPAAITLTDSQQLVVPSEDDAVQSR